MADRREEILVRLEAICQGIADVDWAGRNKLLSDQYDAARITVLEGEEIVSDVPIGNRQAADKDHVLMIPEILIAAAARSSDVGSDLNLFRGRLIKAVLTDAELLALTLNRRGIRYGGLSSDLQFAALMEGKMSIKFRITYMLDPKAF